MTNAETRKQEFLKDFAKLLDKHKVQLCVEEFDIPNWGHGDFKMVAEFEWDLNDENSCPVNDVVLGGIVDKNVEQDCK